MLTDKASFRGFALSMTNIENTIDTNPTWSFIHLFGSPPSVIVQMQYWVGVGCGFRGADSTVRGGIGHLTGRLI